MTMTQTAPLSKDAWAKLATVSTATLTTALFERGFHSAFLQGPRPLNPSGPRMVGPAYTLRYIPPRDDIDPLKAFEDRPHPRRKGAEECPASHVMVFDSRGDPRAASAGGILVTRLMRRGCASLVIDSGFQNSPEITGLPFPAYHQRPSAPTNLILNHAVDLNVPIACGEVEIFPGDVMVEDAEGVVCIPAHLAEEIAKEALEQSVYEDCGEEVQGGHGLFELYPMLDPAVWKDPTRNTFRVGLTSTTV